MQVLQNSENNRAFEIIFEDEDEELFLKLLMYEDGEEMGLGDAIKAGIKGLKYDVTSHGKMMPWPE